MDKDTIIRLARDAHAAMLASGRGMYLWHGDAYAGDVQDFLYRFAALVAAAEREECAKVCNDRFGVERIAQECAAAIRSRGCPPCHGDCNQGRTCPARKQ